jgi:hypothetical protein
MQRLPTQPCLVITNAAGAKKALAAFAKKRIRRNPVKKEEHEK